MPLTNKQLGQRLRARRCELQLDRKALADLLGLAPSTIGNYEIGRRALPATALPALACALHVSILYFFGQEDARPAEPLDSARKLHIELLAYLNAHDHD